jgi:hypothetical protein
MTIVGGTGQPIFSTINGRLMDALIASKNNDSNATDSFSHDAYEKICIIFGIGIAILIISMIQVLVTFNIGSSSK